MPKFYLWREDSSTDYAIVEAADEEAALALIEDGDDAVSWTGQRYNADYSVEPFPHA